VFITYLSFPIIFIKGRDRPDTTAETKHEYEEKLMFCCIRTTRSSLQVVYMIVERTVQPREFRLVMICSLDDSHLPTRCKCVLDYPDRTKRVEHLHVIWATETQE
jgi:hypothetical protein